MREEPNQLYKLPDLALGPEWALLELITLGPDRANQREGLAELLSMRLDWNTVIEQAKRHEILPLLAHYIAQMDSDREVVPTEVRATLTASLGKSRVIWQKFRIEASRIIEALDAARIPCVVNKGLALSPMLYGNNGSRQMNDMDFIVSSQFSRNVQEALRRLSYQMGRFDAATGSVRPQERAELVAIRLQPDHLPVHTIMTGDPEVPSVLADFATTLSWHNSAFGITLEQFLGDRRYETYEGFPCGRVPCLPPEVQFIAVVLHLFREAWMERSILLQRDVSLRKFGDVLRLWSRHHTDLTKPQFVRLLREMKVENEIRWVLFHMDQTFQTRSFDQLGFDGLLEDSYIHGAWRMGRQQLYWIGTMRQRLQCMDRRMLFPDFVQQFAAAGRDRSGDPAFIGPS